MSQISPSRSVFDMIEAFGMRHLTSGRLGLITSSPLLPSCH